MAGKRKDWRGLHLVLGRRHPAAEDRARERVLERQFWCPVVDEGGARVIPLAGAVRAHDGLREPR
jgi:hypothetical protein